MMNVLVDLSFHVRFEFVRALVDLTLLRIALRLHFLVLKPQWLVRVLGGGTKTTVNKPVAM